MPEPNVGTVRAVRIPVTVKMRAGWNDTSRNAADLARRVEDAGAAAVTIHGRTAEQWVRTGLEGAPPAMRALIRVVHRVVLGFRLGPHPSPDHVLGWRIAASEPDVVRLEASSWLVRAVIVGRRVGLHTTRLTTFLFYERPVPARIVWTVVGPVHRRVAPYLLARAAERPPQRSV